MQTLDYIKQYSQLYINYTAGPKEEMADLDSFIAQYTYIPIPSRGEIVGQIELHMFWQIPLPLSLIEAIEYWTEQGVFFKSNPDVYYYVNKKYWPLVKYSVGAKLNCRNISARDFTWSMALYKKAPWHFDLGKHNYNSLECLKCIPSKSKVSQIVNLECLKYLVEKDMCANDSVKYSAEIDDVDSLKHMFELIGINLAEYKDNVYYEITGANAGEGLPIHSLRDALQSAVYKQSFKCIEYLSISSYAMREMMTLASVTKCLPVIRFLHKRGADAKDAIWTAAMNGDLEILKYYHESGMSLDKALRGAAWRGHFECVKYLCDNGASLVYSLERAMTNVKCVKYLFERGGTLNHWPTLVDDECYESLVYLHSQGIPLTRFNVNPNSRTSSRVKAYMLKHA